MVMVVRVVFNYDFDYASVVAGRSAFGFPMVATVLLEL